MVSYTHMKGLILMKNIIAFAITIILLLGSASASVLDMANVPQGKLNFDIFRYICSTVSKTDSSSNSQNTNTSHKGSVTVRSMARSMCVADSVSRAIVNDIEVVKVVYHTGSKGNVYECYFSDKSYTRNAKYTYEDITKGSIFYVGLTDDAFVTNYVVVATVSKSTGLFEPDEAAVSANFSAKKVTCTYSYISDVITKNGVTTIILGNGKDLTLSDDALEFVLCNDGKHTSIYSGDFYSNGVDIPEYDDKNDITEVYMVFAMNYEDETVAICSVTTPAYIKGNVQK